MNVSHHLSADRRKTLCITQEVEPLHSKQFGRWPGGSNASVLTQLNKALTSAKARAQHEGSDRHSNPRRAQRDFRAQSQAKSDALVIGKKIELVRRLDAENIRVDLDNSLNLYFQLGDLTTYPIGTSDFIADQVEIIRQSENAAEAKKALTLFAFTSHVDRDISWLKHRLEGINTSKFRTSFLTGAGFFHGDQLTEFGRATMFFTEHEGAYGYYWRVTPTGISWVYRTYLAGNVLMKRHVKHPSRDIELDQVLIDVPLPKDLDPKLSLLCGRYT